MQILNLISYYNLPLSDLNCLGQVALVVKNPPTNAGEVQDVGSMNPKLGRSLGVGNGHLLNRPDLSQLCSQVDKTRINYYLSLHKVCTKQEKNINIGLTLFLLLHHAVVHIHIWQNIKIFVYIFFGCFTNPTRVGYVCVHTWGGGDKIKFSSPLKKQP